MRSNNAVLAVVLGASVATLCTSGCKKTSEVDRRRQTSEVELRSARVEPQMQRASGKNDYFATVRREQLQLRARIQEDIADVDEKLAALKVERRPAGPAGPTGPTLNGQYVVDPTSKNAARVRQLLERRHRLEAHAATVERADERGWDELKATVEQDLRD